jgi:hypothetical protein
MGHFSNLRPIRRRRRVMIPLRIAPAFHPLDAPPGVIIRCVPMVDPAAKRGSAFFIDRHGISLRSHFVQGERVVGPIVAAAK